MKNQKILIWLKSLRQNLRHTHNEISGMTADILDLIIARVHDYPDYLEKTLSKPIYKALSDNLDNIKIDDFKRAVPVFTLRTFGWTETVLNEAVAITFDTLSKPYLN